VPPELDQPGFVGMQFQPELRKSLSKVGQEPLCVILILEASGEIVREAHDDHVAARVAFPPPLDPQVEDVVQVHVSEQR